MASGCANQAMHDEGSKVWFVPERSTERQPISCASTAGGTLAGSCAGGHSHTPPDTHAHNHPMKQQQHPEEYQFCNHA